MEVKTEFEAVEIDLTPGSKDTGFSIRIDKDWNIVIRKSEQENQEDARRFRDADDGRIE